MSDDWKEEKKEYSVFPNHMYKEDYLKILLCEDVVFINNGYWIKDWPKDHITIHANCSDIFAWGCADAEDVLYSELKDLYQMWKKDPSWGPAVWCIKKRKQKPQEPVEDLIREAGIWNLDEILKESKNE